MGAQPTHVSVKYTVSMFFGLERGLSPLPPLHPCPYISYYYLGPRMLGVETTFKIPRVKK